jgi:hypothetical protein
MGGAVRRRGWWRRRGRDRRRDESRRRERKNKENGEEGAVRRRGNGGGGGGGDSFQPVFLSETQQSSHYLILYVGTVTHITAKQRTEKEVLLLLYRNSSRRSGCGDSCNRQKEEVQVRKDFLLYRGT